MSIWRCHKPVIARVHGDAVAGGNDIIIMNEKARIGYPPSRVWGCPTTAMWVYRLDAEKAKQMLFTGDLISGKRAAEMGLVFQSVALSELDEAVNQLANRIKGVLKLIRRMFQSAALKRTRSSRLIRLAKFVLRLTATWSVTTTTSRYDLKACIGLSDFTKHAQHAYIFNLLSNHRKKLHDKSGICLHTTVK